MRVAVVHDWLTVYGGAEKVLQQILKLFPDADLFSVVDFFPDALRRNLQGKRAQTTFIQRLPFAQTLYRSYLPFMPLAIEQLDLSGYDLIISSSHAVAKGVLVAPGQRHVCYCHTPLRYAWDLQETYLKGKKRPLTRFALHRLRMWDVISSNRVDAFVANSQFVAERIQKCYRRPAAVVYPPVSLAALPFREHKSDYYVTASRLVGYKRVDLIVQAFNRMPSRKLVVIGDGPEMASLKKMGGPHITFKGHISDESLGEYLSLARAFVYAALEDFGIAPLEAQGCGTPVIAYGKGGVKETCATTATFFMKQTPEALVEAIESFEKSPPIAPQLCLENAQKFSEDRFQSEFLQQIGITR